jgi:hypothetical protein
VGCKIVNVPAGTLHGVHQIGVNMCELPRATGTAKKGERSPPEQKKAALAGGELRILRTLLSSAEANVKSISISRCGRNSFGAVAYP